MPETPPTHPANALGAEPDETLVRLAIGGDRRAFDVLIDRHIDRVVAIGFARLRDRDAAEDLAQEVFLRAWLHLGSLRDGTRLDAWLARMTRNLASNRRRASGRQERLAAMVPIDTQVLEQVADEREDAPARLQREEAEKALLAALDRLDPKDRELVLLHVVEEVSQRDIAAKEGTHHTTVGRRLEKALGSLRAMLGAGLEAARGIRASKRARVMASALVAGTLTMPADARAALVAKAVPPVGPLSGIAPSLDPILAKIALGAQAMTAAQKTFAAIAVAAAVIGTGYVTTASPSKATPSNIVADAKLPEGAFPATRGFSGEQVIRLGVGQSTTLDLETPAVAVPSLTQYADGIARIEMKAVSEDLLELELTMQSGKVERRNLRPDADSPEQWKLTTTVQMWDDLNRVFLRTAAVRRVPGGLEVAIFNMNRPDLLPVIEESEAKLARQEITPQAHNAFVKDLFAKNGMIPQDPDLQRAIMLAVDDMGGGR